MSRLNRDWLAPVLLGLAVLAMALWLWRWGLRSHVWGNDEELYRHYARGLARDFPGGVFHLPVTYGRGIQRLHLFLMALPMVFFKNPPAFELAHLEFAGVYASSAIPAWLVARGCGLSRWQALVPAVLVVLTPWAVVTTSFLVEPVGYGMFAWALWAIWRAAVKPSLGGDALALALLFLAVVSRTGFILLVPLLPVLAVLQAWHVAAGNGTRGERLRRLPRAAITRQPLAVTLGLAGVALLGAARVGILPGGIQRFTGGYNTGLPPLNEILLKWRTFLSRIAAGTGFVAFAAGVPWIVVRAARPRTPATFAFAWTAGLSILAVLMALVWSAGDERYVMFVAVPVVVAASVALLRRDIGAIPLALGAAGALALYFSPGWHLTDTSDFGYFSYPAEAFMGRVVLVKLAHGINGTTAGALLLAIGLVAVVALAARPRWRRLLPLALVPAALFQLANSDYALSRHANTVGAAHGPGLHARSFVDTHVPKGEQVGLFAVSNGATGNYSFAWREVQYWNTTMRSVVKVQSPFTDVQVQPPYPYSTFDIQPTLDERTGKLSYHGPFKLPRYLVAPLPPLAVTLDWERITQSSYLPVALVRVRSWRARTTMAGATAEGFVVANEPVVYTVYRDAIHGARCAFADLLAPQPAKPRPGVRFRYRVRTGDHVIASGSLQPTQRRRIFMPLDFGGRGRIQFQQTSPDAVVLPAGQKLGLQVGNFDTLPGRCPKSSS